MGVGYIKVTGVWLLTALCGLQAAMAVPDAQEQTELKRETITAVMLWKFALFTQWPDRTDASSESFRIAILGDNPVLEAALKPYAEKTINDQPVTINRYKKSRDVAGVQLLFICKNKKMSEPDRLRLIADGTLLCSAQKGFAEAGGMIELVLEKGEHPQFEINLASLRAAELEIRARILAMASRVHSDDQTGSRHD